MPFSIEGSVSGGTFNAVTGDLNQVSGNLTQVFNSQVHSSATPALDGPGGALALSSPDNQSVIGALRHQRRALRAQSAPYSKELRTIGDRSEASDAVASETSPNLQASSSTSSAAIPYEHIPGYHGNVSVDLIPLSEHHGVHDSGEEFSPHTFNNVAGNMTQLRVTSYGESGIDILYRHISMGAVYNSGEQLPDPACHPGTRVAVLEQLSGWSSDDRTETTILWLRGSAGMGKSAIAQMFAGGCSRLGASFFFRRGSPERRSWHRLFTTLAYQLARSVPGLAVPIQHAVETDKLVVNQPMTLQFQRLIVEPLKQVPVGGVVPVLVLDGLDECEDEEIQQDILRLFINAIHEQKLRVRLLLSSRPEPHIKEVLENQATLGICRNLELFPDESAYADIRRYLQDEFSKIRVEFVAREIDLGEVWPTPDVVDHLVKKSCGIFIYAATVISFVGDQYRHPQEELESVLNLDPKSTAPLDDLYTQILSTLNRPTRSDRKNVVASATNRQLRILHILWQMSLRPFPLHVDPEEVDELLNLSSGTSRLILRRLHSLLIVPSRRSRVGLRPQVEFLHASFPDYLGDSQRSKEWCVSTGWLHSDYLFGMIRVLSSPPVTDSAMAFHREVALALPRVLSGATPCHEVFAVLRNEVFQRSLFLVGEQPASECIPWPQVSAHRHIGFN
ncbi:hypothetical protein C8F04DRAFT_103648 [Mycena alexandri]|uniref:Nephrocystin 3-like N-terminal domain-containing protein n=1 Tax=Mycena alexandri TaxID=1745969 RepID=A0AAD6SG11_9AGAR|nr:hypothetical protein C8F04DRAFT_103648 [Mycena alexandri]